ncbi:MAG TPA: lysylphosphatidylglycerol synthase transmembrane domain-containing protein [Gemmatimonadales bacterium]|nr:lysylphosphatidylglycerol synthase transmembrane domain-containing protein [Gemmatimonadales bacterium]
MSSPPVSQRPPVWQALLGIVVSATLLWWSLKDVNFAEVLLHLREARLVPIIAGVVMATLTFVLRIFRWQLLLRAEDGSRLPPGPLWHAIAMGFMANNVLPLRIGEVVRTFAATRLAGVRFTAALSSIAVERMFDALTVGFFLGLGLLLAGLPADAEVGGVHMGRLATLVGVAAVAGLALAGAVVAFPRAAEATVRKLVPFKGLADRLVTIIEGIRQGLSALQSPVRILGVILWSLAIWGLSALSFYVMFAAFGIEVSFAGALLMQSLIMFGIAVPSTPGYVGVFEAPIIAVLGLYHVDASLAATYAFTYHITTFIPITLLGAWSVARTNIGLRDLRRSPG